MGPVPDHSSACPCLCVSMTSNPKATSLSPSMRTWRYLSMTKTRGRIQVLSMRCPSIFRTVPSTVIANEMDGVYNLSNQKCLLRQVMIVVTNTVSHVSKSRNTTIALHGVIAGRPERSTDRCRSPKQFGSARFAPRRYCRTAPRLWVGLSIAP